MDDDEFMDNEDTHLQYVILCFDPILYYIVIIYINIWMFV